MSLRANQIVEESPEFEAEIERYRQYLKDEAIQVYETFVPGASVGGGGEFFRVRTASDHRTDLQETGKALATAIEQLDATEEWIVAAVLALGTRAFQDMPLPPTVRRRGRGWPEFLASHFQEER